MRHGHETRRVWAILRATFFLAASRQGGDSCAVVVTFAVKNFRLLAAMMLVADLADHFEAFFIRLRTRVRIVNAVEAGHLVDQHFSKVCAGDCPCHTAKETHFGHFICNRLADPLAAIAYVDCPNATGHGINVLFAFDVPNLNAFAFYNDTGVNAIFVRFMLRKVVPDVRAVSFNDSAGIVR